MRSALSNHVHSVFSDYRPGDCPIPDVEDCHVHAAAEDGGMAYLITNDRHFLNLDQDTADELSYEILSPDDFFSLVTDSHESAVRLVALKQLAYWSGKKGSTEAPAGIIGNLEQAGCPTFAERIRTLLEEELRKPVS